MRLPDKFVAIDTETDGLDVWRGHRPFSACAAFPNGERRFYYNNFEELYRILEDPTIDKVFTNAKFDIRMLKFHGATIRGKTWDTMILGYLLDGRQALDLDSMSRRYCPNEPRKQVIDIDAWFSEYGVKRKMDRNFRDLPREIIQSRVVGDAHLSLKLFERLYPTVSSVFPLLLDQEHRLLPVVMRMEDRGIQVDLEEIEKQIAGFNTKIAEVQLFCEGLIGTDDFNLNSRKDQILLFQKAGLWDTLLARAASHEQYRTPKGAPKLDDFNLRTLHHPVAHMFLLGKACGKMVGTFLEGMRDRAIDGVIHPTFNQTGTTTGRFSSSNPNLQNIPIEGDRRTAYTESEAEEAFEMTGMEYAPHLKRIFKVREGYAHIHSDKARAEIVMLAHYSKDQTLMELMQKEGADIHAEICMRLYGEMTKGLRTRTKAVVFGFMYGAGIPTLARKIGATEDVARDTKKRLERLLPGLPRWLRQLTERIFELGYVQTDHGRRHYLAPEESYISVNRMCQGTVGDEVKSRMVAIGEYLIKEGIDGTVLLNVHDDIGTEVPADITKHITPEIKRIMTETAIPYRLPVPSSLDITYTRWSDLVEVSDVSKVPDAKQAWDIKHKKEKKAA